MVTRWSVLRKSLFLVLFWMKTFHGNHIFHMLLEKSSNLLVLLVDQVLVSLSLPWKRCVNPVLGFNIPYNLNRLILLHKRSVRIILIVNKRAFDAHADPLFWELKFLQFVDNYSLHPGKLIYSYNNNFLPSFSNFFLRTNQVHSNH